MSNCCLLCLVIRECVSLIIQKKKMENKFTTLRIRYIDVNQFYMHTFRRAARLDRLMEHIWSSKLPYGAIPIPALRISACNFLPDCWYSCTKLSVDVKELRSKGMNVTAKLVLGSISCSAFILSLMSMYSVFIRWIA